MARYGTTTTAAPAEVLRRAVETFGAKGHGLQLSNRDMTTARFDSPVGHVAIEAERAPDGQTAVDLETREFDNEVIAFINALPGHSLFQTLLQRLKLKRRP